MVSIVKEYYPESGPSLTLTYQTQHELDPEGPLRDEVNRIMRDFESDAESAEVTAAVISARDEPSGWPMYTWNAYTFVYVQQPDGSWKLYED